MFAYITNTKSVTYPIIMKTIKIEVNHTYHHIYFIYLERIIKWHIYLCKAYKMNAAYMIIMVRTLISRG